MSKARDVNAFFWAMSMLPIQALSMRTCATRLPPSSATAMFIGCPISEAFFSAAAITLRASSKRIGAPFEKLIARPRLLPGFECQPNQFVTIRSRSLFRHLENDFELNRGAQRETCHTVHQ